MDDLEVLTGQLDIILEALQATDSTGLPTLQEYVNAQLTTLMAAEAPLPDLLLRLVRIVLGRTCPGILPLLRLSGSIAEGAMMARCFQCKEAWREIEGDIMYNFFSLSAEVRDKIEAVDGKPGFVRLLYDPLYTDYLGPAIPRNFQAQKEYVPASPAKYVDPLIVKANVRNLVHFQDNEKHIEKIFTLFYGKCHVVGSDEATETTTEVSIDVRKDDGSHIIHISIDHVPSLHLQYWPHQAAAWITRPRHWPPAETIQNIVGQGCHLVPRSSPGGDAHSEWRLSFSVAEAELAKLRSPGQQQAYYFFKVLFYKYLKCVEPQEDEEGKKPLYSYIMKTVMLWASEQHPPDDDVWRSLEASVGMLLSELLKRLEIGVVPHFFIPQINLLERTSLLVRQKCIAIIKNLQKNVFLAAPFDMKEKSDWVNHIQTNLTNSLLITSLVIGAM